jgi:hypothetical protein
MLKDYLITYGFKQAFFNLYVFYTKAGDLILSIYIDDVLITGISCEIDRFLTTMTK